MSSAFTFTLSILLRTSTAGFLPSTAKIAWSSGGTWVADPGGGVSVPTGTDLDRLRNALQTAPQRVMGAAARASRSALARSIDLGFQQHVDIHGKPYPIPKSGGTPLEKTDHLRKAVKVDVLPGTDTWTIRAHEETPYGVFLRDGTDRMAARQWIPRPDEVLPPLWDARQRAAIDRAVKLEEIE